MPAFLLVLTIAAIDPLMMECVLHLEKDDDALGAPTAGAPPVRPCLLEGRRGGGSFERFVDEARLAASSEALAWIPTSALPGLKQHCR